MVRVITQETFDAVVKENVDELGMSREEAIVDAKEQFTLQARRQPIQLVRLLSKMPLL